MSAMPPIISIARLGKTYASGHVALDDIHLDIRRGEIFALLGPNGAGKTTAFYMIVGLVPADAGRIELGDRDLTTLPMHRRAQLGVGYLPQEPSIFRRLSVEQNIMAILELDQELDAAGRAARLEEILAELRIAHVRGNAGMALSGGERRRAEIA